MFSFADFMGLGAQDYSVHLRCFSAPFFSKYDKSKINELNHGGKILLPNSALDALVRRHIQWPMLFKISPLNPDNQKCTHAGVLEFIADEGKCYLPVWMMDQLGVMEGDLVNIEYRSLPKAVYAKFKPMSTDFLHISNPRAMLEVELRKFACLTKNDIFSVRYNDQVYEFKVMDVKPQNAVTIIECDVNIEFDAPEGYVEPVRQKENKVKERETMPEVPETKPVGFIPFSGAGTRLDGKSGSSKGHPSSSESNEAPKNVVIADKTRFVVDENYKPGDLSFIRHDYKSFSTLNRLKQENEENDKLAVFMGKGQSIKSSKK